MVPRVRLRAVGSRARFVAGAALAAACAEPPPEALPADALEPCLDCPAAGVPEGACGPGFRNDGLGGCSAILPAAACGPAEIAVPGDESCRPIAPCGEGTWGDIPAEATTQHVDAAYSGDSDGSAARPWTHIQDAIAAAEPNALVAVAAGDYLEDLTIVDKPVRLWGRCPALVTLTAAGVQPAAIFVVQPGASGTLVRGLAITGPAGGIGISGASARLEALWLHDLAERGIFASADLGPGVLEVENVSVERSRYVGILVQGYQVLVARSVVRSTDPATGSLVDGRGINVDDHVDLGLRSALTVRDSLIEDNHTLGIYFAGSDGIVDGVVVRGTQPRASNGLAGRGIGIEDDAASGERADVRVMRTLIEDNHDVGIFVGGADATISHVTVKGTLPRPGSGLFGSALSAERAGDTGASANVTVSESCFADNHHVTVSVFDSTASLTRNVVRTTRTRPDGLFGDGISVVALAGPALLNLEGGTISDNARAGIGAFGASVNVGGAQIRCNAFDLTGEATAAGPFSFINEGDNQCGCQAPEVCQVVSATLEAPTPAGS